MVRADPTVPFIAPLMTLQKTACPKVVLKATPMHPKLVPINPMFNTNFLPTLGWSAALPQSILVMI
jgi:hypothetical protein